MSAHLAEELARLGVSTIYEAAGRCGLIDVPLVQLVPRSRAAGPARTVACGQDDNLMVHAALDVVRPGEVVVLSMPEARPCALVGEILALQAQARGAAALLVDAAVRDHDELVALGLPIWARFVRSRGATKTRVGSINQPVTLGGTEISPGDMVVLDADGAVVLPVARVDEVLETSRARAAREAELLAKLRTGALTYDLHGLRAVVERTGS